MDKLVKLIDTELKRIEEEGLAGNNLMELDKLVDIKKDIRCIEDMEKGGMEEMRYRGDYDRSYGNYGNYGNNYSGGYREVEGRYGARGYDSKYRGDRYLGEMQDYYGRYMGERERYGADETTMKSLEHMLESTVDFVKMLKDEAKSQEEVDLIQEYSRRIAQM